MRIIPNLLVILHSIAIVALATLAVITIMVIVSYVIRRYELGNRRTADADIFGAAPVFDRVLGIAGEVAAVFICVLLYPLGYVMGEPSRAKLRHGEQAVILFLLRYMLRKAGHNNVILPNFRPASASIPCFAEQLSEVVDLALSRTGCDQVALVGHSMGGLIVRYFMEKLGGASRVLTAITLASPHLGTKTAGLGLFKTAEQFRPDSAFIRDLNQSPPSLGSVNMISIWSEFDNVVLPPENARLPEPCTNQMVTSVGHVAFLLSPQVFKKVRRALRENPATLRYGHDKA
jgi:pimeloyl-ACP methyl ester carboxylesterase